MSNLPLVSVLMPVYNSSLFIKESVESILNQTYQNFELLIYDDSSEDETIEIIESYTDSRIQLFKKKERTGYIDSLVKGIAASKGKYLARMDHDDVSDLKRFEKQVTFLEQNLEYGIVGTFLSTISNSSKSEKWRYPEKDEDIRIYLLANSPFVHPSVMIRKSVLTEHDLTYDINYGPCEDYLLWVSLLKFAKGYNVPEFLLNYRLHSTQTFDQRKAELIQKANSIRARVIYQLTGYKATAAEMVTHYFLFNELSKTGMIEIQQRRSWKNKLIRLFENQPAYQRFIDAAFSRNLETLCEFHPKLLSLIWDNAIQTWSFKRRALFFIKCMLFHKSISAK